MPQQQGGVPESDMYASPGWSWGAFIMGPMFIIAVRKYTLLLLYLLMFIPIVNFLAQFGIMIYLGLKGRELAAASPTFSSREQYIGFMKAIDHAGWIMFLIALAMLLVFGVVFVMLGAAFMRGF
jgi:hypothetical protein